MLNFEVTIKFHSFCLMLQQKKTSECFEKQNHV